MTGMIRLVSLQPMVPLVLLQPAGLPWGSRSHVTSRGLSSYVLTVVLQEQIQVFYLLLLNYCATDVHCPLFDSSLPTLSLNLLMCCSLYQTAVCGRVYAF